MSRAAAARSPDVLVSLLSRHAQAVPIPRPTSTTGEFLAVVVPIAAGLLLAAIAAYKRGGLPGGD